MFHSKKDDVNTRTQTQKLPAIVLALYGTADFFHKKQDQFILPSE